MAREIRRYVHGVIGGYLWCGEIGFKEVKASILPTDAPTYPYGGPYPDLRTALLALTNDGDFQSCGFIPGETFITVEVMDYEPGHTLRKLSRTRPMRFACSMTDDLVAEKEVIEAFDPDVIYLNCLRVYRGDNGLE